MLLRRIAGYGMLVMAVVLMVNIVVRVDGGHVLPGGESPLSVIGAVGFGLAGGIALGGDGQ